MKPIIGITLDAEEIGGYSKWHPWYAIRKNYVEVVEQTGGVAVLLPHSPENAALYFEMVDGLIITGGDFDIDPSLYGATTRHEKVTTKPGRTDFESAIAKLAIEKNKAILGICGGEQLINVLLGGTLIQHIPDVTGNSIHEQKHHRREPAHIIKIEKNSLLHKIVGNQEMQVNSTHHQSVEKLGAGLKTSATHPDDNIIEAIELPEHRFCLGVQWHPEYQADPTGGDKKIFQAFVNAAKNS